MSGVVIRQVVSGGAADRAGLRSIELDRSGNVRSFDTIVGVDDKEIASYSDLFEALEEREAGDRVSIYYARDGERRKLDLQLERIN